MTERVLGPTGGRRRKRLALLVPFIAIAALVLAIGASAGPVGIAAGFEDDDGNLVDNAIPPADNAGIDWNTFATTSWTGTAPYQTSTKTSNSFAFTGISDAEAVTSDTNFNGGVKQDDDCAATGGGKSSNKDDLKRIYVASKTAANGHTYLELAWVRIPQNTTSPSAHVAFEFNQNDGSNNTGCGGSSPLVKRSTANHGDMLIVYDFEGGSGDTPTLTLRRWVGSGSCEVSSDSPPCWGTAVNLTQSGIAEAKVNVGSTVADTISPSSPASVTLGLSEFGEAGVDLTDAGVFTPGVCSGFGKVYGVSRSSGNSGTAQMKDLVGPGNINLTNCGTVTIIKHTSPANLSKDFSFTSASSPLSGDCTAETSPASFTLNDAGTDTETCTNVPAGNYTVTEGADPAGFVFSDLSCTASGTGTSATPASGNATRVASITMAGGGAVTCTYTNTQQLGAIKITKTSIKTGGAVLAGAEFTIGGGVGVKTTDSNGVICVDGLGFATYSVQETKAPAGYTIDDTASHDVVVNNNAKCSDSPFVGETVSATDTPLTDITVEAKTQATGGTASSINCVVEGSSPAVHIGNSPEPDSGFAANPKVTATGTSGVVPGTYVCTIVVDP
jgi:prealbumin domain-containing protein